MTPSRSTSTPLAARPATTAASRNSPEARGSRPTTATGRRRASSALANAPVPASTSVAAAARLIASPAVSSLPATPLTPAVPNSRPMYPAPCLSTQLVYPTPGARLTLGVLRRLTGLLETGLLALLDPRVPGQEAGSLERGATVGVDKDQRPGDTQAQRARLAGDAAAGDPADHVELLLGAQGDERLVDELLVHLVREVLVERPVVDLPLAGAGGDAHPRDGLLAPSGAQRVAGDDGLARRGGGPLGGVAGLRGVLRQRLDAALVGRPGFQRVSGLRHDSFPRTS